MKIQSFSLSMEARSQSMKKLAVSEHLSQEFEGGGPPNALNSGTSEQGVLIDIGEEARRRSNSLKASNNADSEAELELSDKDKQKIALIEKFLEIWTGEKIKIRILSGERPSTQSKENDINLKFEVKSGKKKFAGTGYFYDRSEKYEESQKLNFSANGKVVTSDGREIQVNFRLKMEYSFSQSVHLEIRTGELAKEPQVKDPLVIIFERGLTALTKEKVSFDLDMDGNREMISVPEAGSGFLALDKNGDGKINDGRELFGAITGDGFKELAEYDADNNGWIDENDPVFFQLRIMEKGRSGEPLTDGSMVEKGVGAIFLGAVRTDYEIKNTENVALGEIKKAGFFLKEDGSAGAVQHVDIIV